MKATVLLYSLLLGGNIASKAIPANVSTAAPAALCFTENKGQVKDQYAQPRKDIDFRLSGNGFNLFVGSAALHYQWCKAVGTDTIQQQVALYRMDVQLLGADPGASLVISEPQHFYEQYYLPGLGVNGAKAKTYTRVSYKNVYPGIDWILYVKDNQVEYDFIVHAGAKVSDIRLQYNGATKLELHNNGNLTAITPMGSITEHAPLSYLQNGQKVSTSFVLHHNILSFETAPYSGVLRIDPVLSWSTYYGGTSEEYTKGGCVTGDRNGNAYLCGYTMSTSNIATKGSFKDTLTPGTDAFLVKCNNKGIVQWATYYGGSGSDYGCTVRCDPSGHIFLGGYTNSTGMATSGGHQTISGGGQDAFLAKFDTSGVREWATYYGGSATEQAYALACDRSGNIFLAGYTNNSITGIATSSAHQLSCGGAQDAFLVKFNSSGVRQWGTYYGGSSNDQALSLACDGDKNIFLAGYTLSTAGIATTGSHQVSNAGAQDGFAVKFDSNGVRQWSTYYGGTEIERCQGIACDPAGNSYLTGYTLSSSGIATPAAHQATFGGGIGGADAFLVKFDRSGVRQWGTYYGDTGDDWGQAICADQSGYLYITGFTSSDTGIATKGGIKDTLDFQDAFVVKFDTSGRRLWGTYYGGEDSDLGYGIHCDEHSGLFIGGMTGSLTHLATTGSHQSIKGGGSNDAFFAKISDCFLVAPAVITGKDTVCRNTVYTYSVAAVAGAISYNWKLPAAWLGSSSTNTISVSIGENSDTIRASANFNCGTGGEIVKPVFVAPLPLVSPAGTVSICSGDSITFSASTATGYTWLLAGLPIPGSSLKDFVAHAAGAYSVVTRHHLGCGDTSKASNVMVHPLPLPVLTSSGLILRTGSFPSYQWNRNGIPIMGATGNSYTVIITSGTYSVSVTDSNGCIATSLSIDAEKLNIHPVTPHMAFTIYPNPASDVLYISAAAMLKLTICSMDGKRLGFYDSSQPIDIRHLVPGVYLLHFSDADGNYSGTAKIIKITSN